MALAKCIITELDGTTRHEYTPLNAVVKFEGNKKPDNLSATFPMQNIIRENYEIAYIQDIADTTYLRAVYPMQLSCLDESGYNNDPVDPIETRFVNITTGKFKGHYALDFNAITQGVECWENGDSVTPTQVTEIDMTKQFDINIWFTPNATQFISGNDEPILWSFYDGTNGIEIGISNQTDGVWRAFIREARGFASAYRGTNETVMNGTDVPTHIRVMRDMDNVVRVFVNGIEDSWQTSGSVPWNGVAVGSYQPVGTVTPMIFGNGRGADDHYKGYIHEIRVYCGAVLSENDAEKIHWTKPTAQFMKFAGRIVKIKDVQTTKKILCESNSYRFTKFKLGGTGSAPVITALTTSFKTLLQSAVDEVDSSFTVRNLDTFAKSGLVPDILSGNIIEIGSFMNFASILLLYSETIMYMTPRKNIIIETNAGKDTDYVFDQNGAVVRYNIKNTEENDLKLVNEVILTGNGVATQRSNITPTSGIVRTIRKNILQIDDANDLDKLALKIRESLQGDYVSDLAPKKYRVEINSPIVHVRYNMNVGLKRKNGANVALGLTNQDVDRTTGGDGTINVRQMELYYPNGSTVIKVGENDIDYFDDVINTVSAEDGLIDTTL